MMARHLSQWHGRLLGARRAGSPPQHFMALVFAQNGYMHLQLVSDRFDDVFGKSICWVKGGATKATQVEPE